MSRMSLKDYLFKSGILENGTREEIEAAKKSYRREYLRKKKQARRKKYRRVSLSFSNRRAKELEVLAKEYKMKFPEFIKECLNAYLEQVYVLPDDTEVRNVEILLRRIGNNVNQIVRLTHRMTIPPETAIKQILGIMEKLDKDITIHLRKPKSLEKVIVDAIEQQPKVIGQLQKILKSYSTDYASKNTTSSR